MTSNLHVWRDALPALPRAQTSILSSPSLTEHEAQDGCAKLFRREPHPALQQWVTLCHAKGAAAGFGQEATLIQVLSAVLAGHSQGAFPSAFAVPHAEDGK